MFLLSLNVQGQQEARVSQLITDLHKTAASVTAAEQKSHKAMAELAAQHDAHCMELRQLQVRFRIKLSTHLPGFAQPVTVNHVGEHIHNQKHSTFCITLFVLSRTQAQPVLPIKLCQC